MCHPNFNRSGRVYGPDEEEFVTLSGENGRLFASVYPPKGSPRGTILLISDAFGRSFFYRNLGLKLANDGYLVILPELYSRMWPLAEGDRAGLQVRHSQYMQSEGLSDMSLCLQYLRERAPESKIGVIGFCVGGTLSMMLCARDRLDAAVVYYGMPARKPVTEYAPFSPLDEVDSFSAPMLGLFAENDDRVDLNSVYMLRDALVNAKKLHEIIVYPRVGHAFLNFDEESDEFPASKDSWDRTMAFLAQHL